MVDFMDFDLKKYFRFYLVLALVLANIAGAKPSTSPKAKQNPKSSKTKKSSKNDINPSLKVTLTQEEIILNSNIKRGSPHTIFIGAGTGYGIEMKIPKNSSASSLDTKQINQSKQEWLHLGFRAGYEYMPLALKRFLGLRVYLDYFLGVRPIGLETLTSSTFLANLNAQGKIYAFKRLEIGWIGGVGIGYGTHDKQISTNDESSGDTNPDDGKGIFLGSVGIFGIIDKHHRVEISSKIPINSFGDRFYTYKPYSVLFVYDYLF